MSVVQLSLEQMIRVNKEIAECGCECHTTPCMHCAPCCNYTYQKPYKLGSWCCSECSMMFDEYPTSCPHNLEWCDKLLEQGK